jgi:hypothetical protein
VPGASARVLSTDPVSPEPSGVKASGNRVLLACRHRALESCYAASDGHGIAGYATGQISAIWAAGSAIAVMLMTSRDSPAGALMEMGDGMRAGGW